MKKNLFAFGLMLLGCGIMAQTPRLVLYEEFTGETCPPCASANPILNSLLAQPTNTPKIVPIKWQVPIPSAPSNTWSLYQTNKVEIDWRWRSNGYGYNPAINSAPSSKIDGQEATVFGASSGHPNGLNNTVINTAQSYTSAFSINMVRAWDKSCSAVNLTITVTASANFNAVGSLVFRTVMVERLIQFSVQPGTNGEKNFEDAAIRSFPTLQAGTSLPSTWTLGQSQTFTLNCPLPSYTRKKTEVAFVGFIQDDGNQKVAQAFRLDKAPVPADALGAIGANAEVTCGNTIAPVVSVRNDGPAAISVLTINPFCDGIPGTPYVWTGNLASTGTTSIQLPSVTTPTAAGQHIFSFDVDMAVPIYNLTSNQNQVTYVVASSYQGNPVSEGFAALLFPPAGWAVINPNNGPGWSRTTNAGAYSTNPRQSMKYDFYNNTVPGDKDEMFLPPIDLSGADVPKLSFDIAYAQRNQNSNDQLDILVSSDCGANWTNVFSQAGSLMTILATPVTTEYVPNIFDGSEWRTEEISLTGFNKPTVIVKFVATASGFGNHLYLDNINLKGTVVGLTKSTNSALSAVIFPNPSNGEVTITLNAQKSGNAKITLLNTLGQTVYTKSATVESGVNNVQIDAKELSGGVYQFILDTNDGTLIKKLSISK